MESLLQFSAKINNFDADFVVFDTSGECVIEASIGPAVSDMDRLGGYARTVLDSDTAGPQRFGRFAEVIAVGLTESDRRVAVAVIDAANCVGAESSADDESLIVDSPIAVRSRDADYLEEILALFARDFQGSTKAAGQMEKVCTELSQTYEELMLLYNLSSHMKVTQSSSSYLQLACDQLTELINVEGIAIFLEKKIDGEKRLALTAGSGLVSIDPGLADILQVHLATELDEGKEALLDSDFDSPLKYDWPDGVKSVIAVALYGADNMIGLMVATNIVDKPDFDSIDVKLFNSVAHQCAVFLENGRLFGDLKELFVGSLKALTSSIDAKDQYTRGHSERVAFISRWITDRLAETTPIAEDDVHRIYLAGLLHDIGKIGISEAVLRKKGKLNEDEMARIKAHPQIGASILSEIKQMKDIVPGVLCHHERIDGKGYPKGLTGDRIPLIGKIISLADSFDAMTSRRVYREALSIKRAVAEIEKGIGTQFDPDVANAFINSDIRKLWSIIQDGFIESWDYSNFSEYGAVAVGTLIR
jgi:HD-GYP domain-containing protein (c-di-GMP phosphodiesterase class II)